MVYCAICECLYTWIFIDFDIAVAFNISRFHSFWELKSSYLIVVLSILIHLNFIVWLFRFDSFHLFFSLRFFVIYGNWSVRQNFQIEFTLNDEWERHKMAASRLFPWIRIHSGTTDFSLDSSIVRRELNGNNRDACEWQNEINRIRADKKIKFYKRKTDFSNEAGKNVEKTVPKNSVLIRMCLNSSASFWFSRT